MNPAICLWHVTKESKIKKIFKEGLDPECHATEDEQTYEALEDALESGDIESEDEFWENHNESPAEAARRELNEISPLHDCSVFFFKKESDIRSPNDEYTVLEIDASKIPCECTEANMDLSDKIFEGYMSLYDEYSSPTDEEELWKLSELYEASMKPLNIKKNNYTTEVICPCKIPPEAIAKQHSGKFKVCPIPEWIKRYKEGD